MKVAARQVPWLLAAVLAAGIACAADPNKQSKFDERLTRLGYTQGPEVERIQRYSIDGWQSLDSEHFIMDAGPSRYYLITLMFPCSGIGFAYDLRFSTTPPGDLTRLDEVIVPQPAVAERCPIKAINVLEKLKNKNKK